MQKYNSLVQKILSLEFSEKELNNLLNEKENSGNFTIKDAHLQYVLNESLLRNNKNVAILIKKNLKKRNLYYTQIRKMFYSLKTPGDFSILIGMNSEEHISIIKEIVSKSQYSVFYLPKKSGGFRTIKAPDDNLKLLQTRLNFILNLVFEPSPNAHGFIFNKNIITNSELHVKQNYILNIDIKDFFPSIKKDRISKLFRSKPYNLSENFVELIADICCFQNSLPQGAPTSPTLTNMICIKLDEKMKDLSSKYICNYSRYADDITFSGMDKAVPDNLLSEIENIISSEGFVINKKKVRINKHSQRQEVTGLIVNEKVNINRKYIRNIRAILHSWKTKGIKEAASLYGFKYSRFRMIGIPDFRTSLKGKIEFIGMVRGKDDYIYNKYNSEYLELKEIQND